MNIFVVAHSTAGSNPLFPDRTAIENGLYGAVDAIRRLKLSGMIEQYPQISDIHFGRSSRGRALSLVTAAWITSRRRSYPDCVRGCAPVISVACA